MLLYYYYINIIILLYYYNLYTIIILSYYYSIIILLLYFYIIYYCMIIYYKIYYYSVVIIMLLLCFCYILFYYYVTLLFFYSVINLLYNYSILFYLSSLAPHLPIPLRRIQNLPNLQASPRDAQRRQPGPKPHQPHPRVALHLPQGPPRNHGRATRRRRPIPPGKAAPLSRIQPHSSARRVLPASLHQGAGERTWGQGGGR